MVSVMAQKRHRPRHKKLQTQVEGCTEIGHNEIGHNVLAIQSAFIMQHVSSCAHK